jgi:Flp pilus assembly protein TadG
MKLRTNTRGAVFVEFLIAFMPLMTIFLSLCELTRYSAARVAVQHAAGIGARACAVTGKPNPTYGNLDGTEADVNTAVQYALKPWTGSALNVPGLNINVPIRGATLSVDAATCTTAATNADPYGTDQVTVTASYTCVIPIAKTLVCSGGAKNISITSSYPHQGANYKLGSVGPDY